jgi:hypothetical protein
LLITAPSGRLKVHPAKITIVEVNDLCPSWRELGVGISTQIIIDRRKNSGDEFNG